MFFFFYLYDIAKKICYQFKYLIEEKGLWNSLYDDKGNPLNENHSQMLFYGIADTYCKANNIDISRKNNNEFDLKDNFIYIGYAESKARNNNLSEASHKKNSFNANGYKIFN